VRNVRRLLKLTIKSIFGHRLADLWRSYEEELEYFLEKIKSDLSRLPDKMADKKELFAHFNTDGSKPPIFWCFNNWTEAVFLAFQLGPDQPLYAMHSLYSITEEEAKKSLHTKRLAEIYGDLLCDLYPQGKVLIGGNCQAVGIAEGMAHYLLGKRGQAPMLISLESQPYYAYPGDVLLLFGDHDEARFNPFLNSESPMTRWQNKHKHVLWGTITGSHGEYFREPGVHQLCKFINYSANHFLHGTQCRAGELVFETQSNKLSLNTHNSSENNKLSTPQ